MKRVVERGLTYGIMSREKGDTRMKGWEMGYTDYRTPEEVNVMVKIMQTSNPDYDFQAVRVIHEIYVEIPKNIN